MKTVIVLLAVSLNIASLSAQIKGPASVTSGLNTGLPLSSLISDEVTTRVPALQPKTGRVVVVNDLMPFTHLALIPASVDPRSIRFQRIKEVTVATRRRLTIDISHCEEASFREPGGSIFCQFVQDEGFTRAYRVTYSYDGPPLASDEYGNKYFTFDVYFHPEELGPFEQSGKIDQGEAAEFFRWNISRTSEPRLVIDASSSTFCAGNYIDGAWVHRDPECMDNVNVKRIAAPSDYITVLVELASPDVNSVARFK